MTTTRSSAGFFHVAGEPLVLWDHRRARWVDLRWLSDLPVRRGERVLLLPPHERRAHSAARRNARVSELTMLASLALVGAAVLGLALATLAG